MNLHQFKAFGTHLATKKSVKGLKTPRFAPPRLGAKKLPGGTPANPFRVNWTKVSSAKPIAQGALGLGALGVLGTAGVLSAKRVLRREKPNRLSLGARTRLLQSAATGSYRPIGVGRAPQRSALGYPPDHR